MQERNSWRFYSSQPAGVTSVLECIPLASVTELLLLCFCYYWVLLPTLVLQVNIDLSNYFLPVCWYYLVHLATELFLPYLLLLLGTLGHIGTSSPRENLAAFNIDLGIWDIICPSCPLWSQLIYEGKLVKRLLLDHHHSMILSADHWHRLDQQCMVNGNNGILWSFILF